MKARILLLFAITAAVSATETLACGDSLYRVGKGVSYRVYTAPLPGSVLVYGQSEGAQQLAKELARSGHGVRLVNDTEELRSELASGSYDVVIASYGDKGAIQSGTSAAPAGSGTRFLPVAQDEAEEAEARKEYDRVMMAQKDEIKHYLKAIHKTLKDKS